MRIICKIVKVPTAISSNSGMSTFSESFNMNARPNRDVSSMPFFSKTVAAHPLKYRIINNITTRQHKTEYACVGVLENKTPYAIIKLNDKWNTVMNMPKQKSTVETFGDSILISNIIIDVARNRAL